MNTYSAEMNTTPLIDVLFVLLTLLILSIPPATHLIAHEMPGIAPPRAALPTVDVDIDSDDQVYWNGQLTADLASLERRFGESTRGGGTLVRIYPDRRARYEKVAQVLAAAQRARVTNLWLAPQA
jgi:biopolymer transport protein ExbD